MSGTRLDITGAHRAAEALPETVTADERRRLQQLPILLRRSGLAATLATLLAASGREVTGAGYGRVAGYLAAVIAPVLQLPVTTAPEDVLTRLGTTTVRDYLLATREAEQLITWLKRFAEARFQASQAAQSGQPEGDGTMAPDDASPVGPS